MPFFKFSLYTAVFATAIKAFNMTCNPDSTLTVHIPYNKTAQVLSLQYGTCNETSAGVTLHAQDTDTNALRVDLDVTRCNMEGNLRNLEYTQNATFLVGRMSGPVRLVFDSYVVESSCSYVESYTVSFNYGTLEAEYERFNETAGVVRLEFALASYSSDYSQEEVSSTQAGNYIYLGIVVNSTGFNYERKMFVPKKCVVQEVGTQISYTLFDAAVSCENEIIDLSVSYVNNMWRISHILFLIGDKESSSYELECGVIVCDVQAASACEAVKTACS